MKNTAKFGRNLIKYMSVQHIWTLSQLLELFTCRKLANLSWNLVTETWKQCPETTRYRFCCEKLGTSPDVKALPLVVEMSVTVNNSPFQDYTHPDNHIPCLMTRFIEVWNRRPLLMFAYSPIHFYRQLIATGFGKINFPVFLKGIR